MEATQDSAGHNDTADMQELDALYEEVMSCEPSIAEPDMYALSAALSSIDVQRATRAGLALASKGGSWFRELADDVETAETVASVLEAIEGAAERLEAAAALLRIGAARAEVALCNHEGFDPTARAFTHEAAAP